MVGLNSLSKLFRKTIGPKLEALGLLPHRYYLNRALDALDADDIDEAVRMITLASPGEKKNDRWRLVCQQVIFRCRILASVHEKQMERIKTEIEIFGKTADMRERYQRLHCTCQQTTASELAEGGSDVFNSVNSELCLVKNNFVFFFLDFSHCHVVGENNIAWAPERV
jgi:hypothetical protein